ncbi:MAG: RNA polymerase sigma factor FliA [Gammaproteobacteria bacterium]|nr:RNA polymerase sigma factor FliA [Gammaproteobacteria bacterium]
MVKHLARHFICRLPSTVQLDDLVQAGMLGLIEAAHHYQGEKGAAFATYATIRIKGSILDEIRRQDWVPRSVYRLSRQVSAAVRQVENRLGRDAKDHEVAAELGLSLDDYYQLLQDAQAAHLYGFDDLGIDDDHLNVAGFSEPQKDALENDFQAFLANLIHTLPKNEQLALSLYYEHELQLKEIGELMGVSESRVSQILSQATHRIRSRLGTSLA